MAFQGGACPPAPRQRRTRQRHTLRVKFWPEPSKWDDRRHSPRSNTQPMQFAIPSDTRNSDGGGDQRGALNAPIGPPALDGHVTVRANGQLRC